MNYKENVITVELDREVHKKVKDICVRYDLVQRRVLNECILLGLEEFVERNIEQ